MGLVNAQRVMLVKILKTTYWADLREDKMINPAPGFRPIVGPLGPTAGPGTFGTGSGSKLAYVPPTSSSGVRL